MKEHSAFNALGSYAPPPNIIPPPPHVRCNAFLGDPMTCPFCDAKPEFYDGAWRVKHDVDCYLFDYSEYEWIIGRKGISKWNTRTPNPSHQPHRTLCGVGLDGVVGGLN